MILDLPPTIEQVIMANAKEQGVSPEQYITSLLPPPTHQRPESFYQAQGMFKGQLKEMLALQQELRDGWD